MSRIKNLMVKCADNMDDGYTPLNDKFLAANQVTADESFALLKQMAVAVRGYARVPDEIAFKVLLASETENAAERAALLEPTDLISQHKSVTAHLKSAVALAPLTPLIALIALPLLILSGCAYYVPTASCSRLGYTGFVVVNNSGAYVDIIQDGKIIASRIATGQVMPIAPIWMRDSVVVVVGYTAEGIYVGADSYIFQAGVREAWTVSRLIRPNSR